MNYENYQSAFESLAKAWFFVPKLRDYLLESGIHPRLFPSCRGSMLIQDFELAAESGGYSRAQVDLLSSFETLEGTTLLPTEPEQLKIAMTGFIAYGTAQELKNKLNQNPLAVFEVCRDFLQKQASSKFMRDDRMSFKGLCLAQAAKIKEGVALVSIPGWSRLSRAIGGFNPGRLTMITAATGRGKTTLAINLALSARKSFPITYFNMEMTFEDMLAKILMAKAGMKFEDWIEKGDNYLDKHIEELCQMHALYVSDGTKWDAAQISAEIRSKAKAGCKLFIIDYDQKIDLRTRDDEWRQIQKVVEFFEESAKENNVHVIILSQANDDGDPKASKRSVQSVSTLLFLTEESKVFYLEAKKNRWGKHGVKIFLDVDFACSKIVESALQDKVIVPEAEVLSWPKKTTRP